MARNDRGMGEHKQADPLQRRGSGVQGPGPPHRAHDGAKEVPEGLPGGPFEDQLTVYAGKSFEVHLLSVIVCPAENVKG